jgi:hypothetical protein
MQGIVAVFVSGVGPAACLQQHLDAGLMSKACGMKNGRPFIILVRNVEALMTYEEPTYVRVPLSSCKVDGILPTAIG